MADTITFLHSGDMGDIVASLCSVKEICERDDAKAVLLVDTTGGLECNEPRLNDAIRVQTCGHGLKMSDSGFLFLRPLLMAQPYIEDALLWKDNRDAHIDRNFNWFRWGLMNPETSRKTGMNLMFAHQNAMGLECRYNGPWLQCPKGDFGGIVVSRSTRYHSSQMMYQRMEKAVMERGRFIGTDLEEMAFADCFRFCPPRMEVHDALEMASVVSSAEMVVVNPTMLFWISVGVGCSGMVHELPVDDGSTYFPSQRPSIVYCTGNKVFK